MVGRGTAHFFVAVERASPSSVRSSCAVHLSIHQRFSQIPPALKVVLGCNILFYFALSYGLQLKTRSSILLLVPLACTHDVPFDRILDSLDHAYPAPDPPVGPLRPTLHLCAAYYVCPHRNLQTLYGFLRLRIPSGTSPILSDLKGCALIRELHVYGKLKKVSFTFVFCCSALRSMAATYVPRKLRMNVPQKASV